MRPTLLIFASGTKIGGGFGFENLALKFRNTQDGATIVGVVTSHADGGVAKIAKTLGIPFYVFMPPRDAAAYRRLIKQTGAQFVAFSGWLHKSVGLDPKTTFNIHPGPLPLTAGKFGEEIHKTVHDAFKSGSIKETAIVMHFVTNEYDKGPAFFRFHIKIATHDTLESLGARVKKWEHWWQPIITTMVVQRKITWDGVDPLSLQIPVDYEIDHYE